MKAKHITKTEINFTSEQNTTIISNGQNDTTQIENQNNSTRIESDNRNQDQYLQITNEELKKIDQQTFSLMTNPVIDAKYRYGVPIILILNIGLFINANLNPGATVGANISLGSFTSETASIKQFTLIQSVSDMWKAGVYPLSIIIALFSGIWPYIKLILMLICWCVNEKHLKQKTRDTLLVILDAAGKWSLVDAYVLVLMIVGFRFQIAAHLGVKEEANIIVAPNWGFYGFFLAAIVSLCSTHIIIHQHRKLNKIKVKQEKAVSNLSSKNSLVTKMVVFSTLISLGLLIAGSIINSFAFSFQGLAGYVLDSEHQTMDYSLLSLGYNLPYDMAEPNSFGARYIQLIFFMLSFVLPIIFILLLGILYIKPMKVQIQEKIFTITEIIYAWSALDVMVVSIVIALVEIQQFADFIIGDGCDGINQLIQLINDNPDMHISIDPPICFTVITTLDIGCVVLFLSAVVFFGLGSITLRQIKARIDETQQNIFKEQELQKKLLSQQDREKVKKDFPQKNLQTSYDQDSDQEQENSIISSKKNSIVQKQESV